MKIIISSTGNTIKSQFDLRFGRAPYFCVIDETDLDSFKFYENFSSNNNKNAGIAAAKKGVSLKATKIISGEFGDQSKKILDEHNIQLIMINEENCTIETLLERLKSNNKS
ncbi:hypothetical protein MKD41_09260 [Lutibacter sp. A64]|uniref:NifB/NifX family molybdenum-iron cluster-binding protein n=1 Tax=Lutibacter sp. A64 TaxID=2918526 RepID=UPI001F05AA40|nr:NifB/NifX family molybdenum-iron cluster-binding protein [Lutibacter sp. A64]UMB52529.1 hypothetical protein MKD41_09260 [Lutibacter sp. A64]